MIRAEAALTTLSLLGFACACRESPPPSSPPSAQLPAAAEVAPTAPEDVSPERPRDDATTARDDGTVVDDDTSGAPPASDGEAGPDVAAIEPRDGSGGPEVQVGTVEPSAVGLTARDPDDRCAAFVAGLATDLEAWIGRPLTAREKRCRVLGKLDELPVIVFEIEELPALEGPWSPSRLAVRSGAKWYVLDLAGHGTRLLKLAAGPWERAFHIELGLEQWEPGSNVGKRRVLHVCRLPEPPGAAPRCARHDITYKYTPLAQEAEREDWIAAVSFTESGLLFQPLKGRYPSDMDKPPVGAITLEAFLSGARGFDLAPE